MGLAERLGRDSVSRLALIIREIIMSEHSIIYTSKMNKQVRKCENNTQNRNHKTGWKT